MVGPIFAQEREWIDAHYWDFDELPPKTQIIILRKARRAVAQYNIEKQQALENTGNPPPKHPKPYYWR